MRAIITGAASGMGRAITHRFAADAAAQETRLLLVDLSAERLETVAGELDGTGAHVITFVGDLADPETCARIGEAAAGELGALDALISNAGIVASQTGLLDLTVEKFELDIAVNARATWLLGKAVHPLLKQSRGSLTATASLASRQVAPLRAPTILPSMPTANLSRPARPMWAVRCLAQCRRGAAPRRLRLFAPRAGGRRRRRW